MTVEDSMTPLTLMYAGKYVIIKASFDAYNCQFFLLVEIAVFKEKISKTCQVIIVHTKF